MIGEILADVISAACTSSSGRTMLVLFVISLLIIGVCVLLMIYNPDLLGHLL